MASVRLNHLYKSYAGAEAPSVNDFHLTIEDREFLVLVGPSGCGKSTTLRMVAGLEEITSGELYIGERLVNRVPPRDRDIAMVFQNYALYPHMDVYQNMSFGLKLRKMPRNEINRRVQDAAKALGISHLLDRKPKALSGGQRQRVALGRAIVRDPQVFLMDEPLSNLDAKLRVQMRTEISKLHQRLQTTVIYVTHDQTEAMTMGQRIVVMSDGYIQQVATPQEIYNQPRNVFVAGFIGSPAMNFVDGTLSEEAGYVYFLARGMRVRIPVARAAVVREKGYVGRDVILGIRPENLHEELVVAEAYPESTFQAKVDVVELLGAEMYLYLNCEGTSLIARVNARADVHSGETMTVAVDVNRLHIFDSETKLAVY